MSNEKHSPWFRRSRSLLLGVTLGIAAAPVARPAFGQANMSCTTQQLNDNEFTCDDCASYQTCFNEATESIYYSVQGQRFECDGYDCTQAREDLLDLCCDTAPASSSAASSDDDGGCALVGRASRASSAAWASAALGVLALRRQRRVRPS